MSFKLSSSVVCATGLLAVVSGRPTLADSMDPDFTDATTGPLGGAEESTGVAWGDYDRDGDLDLYISNADPNKLLRNDGDGEFTDVTTGPLGDLGSGVGVAWGDYDNDGDLDLYIANFAGFSPGANKLLRNDGSGVFADATTGPLAYSASCQGVAWGDYDRDGDPDLYVSGIGANKLLRNDGSGFFADATTGPLGDTGSGFGVAWADYDNDGDLDLYICNYGSANKLLRNDGASVFTDVTAGPLGDTGSSVGTAWGDYDNDGDLDLYICNYESANKLLRNDGVSGFTDVTTGPLEDPRSSRGVAWGDYDNDGDLDLYVCSSGANKLLRNDQASGNHWLHVDLVGAISNRAAIGARVMAFAGGAHQIREVSGGSGYLSQDSLTAEFGLGTSTTVDSLIVRWPSGIVNTYEHGISVDSRITVGESQGGATAIHSPAAAMTCHLYPATPNPFNPTTTITYSGAGEGIVTLVVYDLAGRRVRTLVDERGFSGTREVQWNGRDELGRRASSGVYLYQLRAGDHVESRTMTLLK